MFLSNRTDNLGLNFPYKGGWKEIAEKDRRAQGFTHKPPSQKQRRGFVGLGKNET